MEIARRLGPRLGEGFAEDEEEEGEKDGETKEEAAAADVMVAPWESSEAEFCFDSRVPRRATPTGAYYTP